MGMPAAPLCTRCVLDARPGRAQNPGVARCLIVMGAAVRSGGAPGGALLRRTQAAARHAQVEPDLLLLVTGGRHHPDRPSEAEVMRRLLREAGIAAERILMEDASRDTASSARACARILAARADVEAVGVCTHAYHMPRARLLFRLLGIRVFTVPVPGSRQREGTTRWLRTRVKEVLATPADGVLMLLRRGR